MEAPACEDNFPYWCDLPTYPSSSFPLAGFRTKARQRVVPPFGIGGRLPPLPPSSLFFAFSKAGGNRGHCSAGSSLEIGERWKGFFWQEFWRRIWRPRRARARARG